MIVLLGPIIHLSPPLDVLRSAFDTSSGPGVLLYYFCILEIYGGRPRSLRRYLNYALNLILGWKYTSSVDRPSLGVYSRVMCVSVYIMVILPP